MNLIRYINVAVIIAAAALLPSCKTAKLSTAEEKQRIGEYYEAAAIYRKVYAKTPPKDRFTRGYIAFRMGECNRMINQVTRASGDYANALRYQYADTTIHLRLAQTSHKRGLYADAIKYYGEYLKINPQYTPALNGISGALLALQWKQSPSRYVVRKMDKLNSRYSEFSPMLYGEKYDQIYFASSRKKAKDSKPSGITGLANNNFYLAKQDEKGIWQPPVEIEDPINTEFDEGVASFTADGSTMYYTYCAQANDAPRTAEIYSASRSSAAWGKGEKVPILKDSVTTLAHPAVSPDGAYLYFVSDATGGYGGKDIFRVKKTGNEFGPMENLGPQINTPADEMFPYVRDSVTLYFASDGHPGMGGLDLFKATLDSAGVWQVENLKPPINSMADDFGITFAGANERGFFSSNRNDLRGSDHLYSFELPQLTVAIEGIVSDVEDNPIENATIRIVGRDGLNEKVSARKDGTYRVELRRDVSYVMMASARGFLNQNFELKTLAEEKSETYLVDFFLSPVYRPVVVENIFYAFNQATLRPESKEALDEMIRLLNDNPNVTIELGAHTDRVGSDAYNEALARRRAQSVVDYLISGGIAPDRLEAKGYGKSVPKTINRKMAERYDFLAEGDILSEEFINNLPADRQEIADQINRRTEFKVLRMNYNLY
jgi:peptidoglycan-associated lipoprotein